jgi:hypothetical protein
MKSERSLPERKRDTLARLDSDNDAWVATARPDGRVWLVPLSFSWDGEYVVFATLETNRTVSNARATGWVQLAIGETRDVITIEGTIDTFPNHSVPEEVAAGLAAQGWDARKQDAPFVYVRVRPQRIRAWREEQGETPADLMRNGRWLV